MGPGGGAPGRARRPLGLGAARRPPKSGRPHTFLHACLASVLPRVGADAGRGDRGLGAAERPDQHVLATGGARSPAARRPGPANATRAQRDAGAARRPLPPSSARVRSRGSSRPPPRPQPRSVRPRASSGTGRNMSRAPDLPSNAHAQPGPPDQGPRIAQRRGPMPCRSHDRGQYIGGPQSLICAQVRSAAARVRSPWPTSSVSSSPTRSRASWASIAWRDSSIASARSPSTWAARSCSPATASRSAT